MTLRKKLILIFLAVAICPMILVGTLGYFSLFGILRNGFPDHDPTRSLELELAEGSSVGDLIDYLEIPRSRLGLFTVGGALVKADAKLTDGDCVRVFQPIAGG